jgi:hypothetical protein
MATWQYEIFLLPSWTTDQRWISPETYAVTEHFDFTSLWERYERRKALRASLAVLLPPAQSWTPEIQMWGSDDGDRIEIVGEGDAISEIVVRLDVRTISNKFVHGIVDIAKEYDLTILTNDNHFIMPDYNGILNAIKTSGAARFVKDPIAFLTAIEKERS